MVGRMVERMEVRMVERMEVRMVGRMVEQMVGRMVEQMVGRIAIDHVTLAPLNGTIAIWYQFRCKTCIYGNREMGDEMRYRLQKYPPTIAIRVGSTMAIHDVTLAPLNGTISIWCYLR